MTASARVSVLLLVFLFNSAAFAQLSRSAVSVNGSDSNACTPAAPCRTFSHAITVTNPGGEMIALDSGGYGPFTIDRPIFVQAAPGIYAGLAASSGAAISVIPGAFSGPVSI